MRILHIASGRLYGGIERVLVTLAQTSPERAAMRVDVAACAPGRLLDELRGTGAASHLLGDVRLSRPVSVWEARTRLRDLLASSAYDAVVTHAPWAFALFAPVADRAGLPRVLWQHDSATGTTLVERWARATAADLVIANSAWTARTTHLVQPSARVVVIPCPVAEPRRVTPRERSALRELLGAGPDDCVLLMASRMESWKGHARMLRAVASLPPSAAWRLWIAGGVQRPSEAEYRATLERLASAQGIAARVSFLGERSDIPEVMQAADVLCQPNTRPEPFGVVFAEALLAGVPVLTTAMGGAVEIVGDSCGRLVRPDDDRALVNAIRELCEDRALRKRLGAAGPAYARQRCSPDVVLRQIENALTACLAPVGT